MSLFQKSKIVVNCLVWKFDQNVWGNFITLKTYHSAVTERSIRYPSETFRLARILLVHSIEISYDAQ